MKMTLKRKFSKEERARLEQGVVVDCYNKMLEKVGNEHDKIAKLEGVIERLENDVLNEQASGTDERTLERMLREIEKFETEKENDIFLSDIFSGVEEVLSDLRLQVEVLMSLGWYDFVIKKIPEKKLDRMISLEKPEEMEKLRSLVLQIMNQIENKIGRDSGKQDLYMKRLQHLRAVRMEMQSFKQDEKKLDTKSKLDKIKAKKAQGSYESVLPLPATNANVATDSNCVVKNS